MTDDNAFANIFYSENMWQQEIFSVGSIYGGISSLEGIMDWTNLTKEILLELFDYLLF